jgi:hypothetical protein
VSRGQRIIPGLHISTTHFAVSCSLNGQLHPLAARIPLTADPHLHAWPRLFGVAFHDEKASLWFSSNNTIWTFD